MPVDPQPYGRYSYTDAVPMKSLTYLILLDTYAKPAAIDLRVPESPKNRNVSSKRICCTRDSSGRPANFHDIATTFTHLRPMSALPPKADIGTQSRNVCFVPKADINAL